MAAAQGHGHGRLALDREFAGAAMAAATALGITREQLPAGDVEGRRKGFEARYSLIASLVPATPSVTQRQHTVPTHDGETIVLTEFFRGPPPTTRPVSGAPSSPALYFIHGGGMILASVKDFAPFIANKCETSGLRIFAVGYRLAPEHPHPTPVNDCYAGLQWLHAHAAELGIDNSRIIVEGESAGGGLAAGTALMARDKGLNPPIAMQMLIYPMLDDRNQTPIPEIEPFAVWRCDDNITGWRALLGEAAGAEHPIEGHEYAAAARAKDVSGLPPTYIDVGGLDIFQLENVKYAMRLVEAGVPVEFHLYPGLPHAFEALGGQAAAVKSALANRQRRLAEFQRA